MTTLIENLRGTRTTSFRFDVLDHAENYLYGLRDVQVGGSIRFDASASVRAGGQITVSDLQDPDVDWLNVRIRPWIIVNGIETPLGVYLCSVPTEQWEDEGRVWAVDMFEKTTILDQDIPEDPETGDPWHYSALVDTNLMEHVVTIINETGEPTPAIIDELGGTVPNYMYWDIGTTRLKIINDLLVAGGFLPLWCDGQGQFRVTPYVSPVDRPPVYDVMEPLGDGINSVTAPDWKRTLDWYAIPNRWVAYAPGDEQVPPGTPGNGRVGVATNENPLDPLSFVNRGRWVTVTETDVDAVNLDLYAQQKLDRARAVYGTFDITHAFLPELTLNSTIRFVNAEANLDVLCVVLETEIPLDPLALCRTTLMEVPL